MRLTPADVHNVAFKKPSIGKRGYDEDEVDAFLDLVEGELSRLIEENNELTQRLAAYESGSTPPAAIGLSKQDADQTPQTPADHSAPESATDTQQTGEQPAVDQNGSAGHQATAEQAGSADQATAADQGSAADQATASDQAAAPAAAAVPAAEQAQQVQQAVAQAPAASSPLADHHMHAARLLGLAEETAQRLTSEAQAHADNTRNSANAESEKLVSDARNQSEQMLTEAKNTSEQMVKEATDQAEAATRDSQLKAEAIDREAQRKYTEVMGQLTEQRTTLEKKIDDLRTYEREYRSRLKGWITEQLTQLDESGATTAPATEGGDQK